MSVRRGNVGSRVTGFVATGALVLVGVTVQLGATPASAASDSAVVEVAAGTRHSCALTEPDGSGEPSGYVWCWGDNGRGQLGRDDVTGSKAPVLVESVANAVAVDAGGAHSCALTAEGDVLCWGANGSGQLGDGTTQDRFGAVRALVSGATAISTGRSHSCALAAQGSNEVQLLSVDASGGTYQIRYQDDGTPPAALTSTIPPIAWNAGPEAIQEALESLTPEWDATVWAGSAPGTYAIAFADGPRAHTNVPSLRVDGSGLTGTGHRLRIDVVADGGQRLLCWGSDAAAQLGRGAITDTDLWLDPLPLAAADSDGANSLAVDPQTGDLFLTDTKQTTIWRFTADGSYVDHHVFVDPPTAIGVATVSDGVRLPSRLRLYVAGDLRRGPIKRFDAGTSELLPSGSLLPWQNPQVVLPGQLADCACKISAMAVDPASGGVFAVASGNIGTNPSTPFLKILRISSDVTNTVAIVDYAASFPNVEAVTDLAVGADDAGRPLLFALERPVSGTDWKISLWDVGGTNQLALRARFPVNPANRAPNDASATADCATQTTTADQLGADTFWSRTTTTYEFGFGRLGAGSDGDVGVITRHTPTSTLTQRYVKDPQAVPQEPANPATEGGGWVTAPDGGPTPITDGTTGVCVNVFAAGSQAQYGRFVTSYRGSAVEDTDLGIASSDVAATNDGRLIVVDTDHERLQQFSADGGDPLTRWPDDEYSAFPAGVRPADTVLGGLASQITGVSAGDSHTCVSSRLIAGGSVGPVLCWGSNSAGQLGYLPGAPAPWIPSVSPDLTGDVTSYPVAPTDPQNSQRLVAGSVSAGGEHTCASDAAPTPVGGPAEAGATVSCWGSGANGRLVGDAPTIEGSVVRMPISHSLLDTGGVHTCLVQSTTGPVKCYGPPGTDTTTVPAATSLSAGSRHACAVAGGVVSCWGSDSDGQTGPFGSGSSVKSEVPIAPRVDVGTSTSLNDPIEVTFHDATSGVSAQSVEITDSGTALQQTTVTCRGPDGAAVSCEDGPVRTAGFRVRGGLVAGETYDVVVNPDAELTAGGRVVAPETVVVAAPTSTEESEIGSAYSWGTARGAAAYGGSWIRESAAGATATYEFRGKSITWFTVRGRSEGVAKVSIDGGRARTIDNSAAKRTFRAPRAFKGLGAGAHTLTITVVGRPGAKGTGRAVSIDALKRGGKVVRSPDVRTAWGEATIPPTAAATDAVTYLSAGEKGAAVRFRFRASVQLEWHTIVGKDQGKADVYIDGELVGRVDNHQTLASGLRNEPTVLPFPVSGGVIHQVRIVAVGTGPGAHLVSVDGFSVS